MALNKSNSLTRRYAKLEKYHDEIMKPSKGKNSDNVFIQVVLLKIC